ncbi:MAG: GatB/YqeY domain-containing protein [Planctomycetota bacterium]|nr:GatB/YqeY domain-containing protein [Planctomycetota bacterium]
MLRDELRDAMLAAMKAGKAVEKNILRVALGEVQTAESRSGEDAPDAEIQKMLRKLIKSIGETRDATPAGAQRVTLDEEIAVLETYLPRTLTVDQIVAALTPHADAIRAAGNDGQAMGLAMKQLKAAGAAVESQDVQAAIRALRS